MNIDEYRAFKAQVQQDEATHVNEQPPNPTPLKEEINNPPNNPPVETPKLEENTNEPIKKIENNIPDKVYIDGVGEITVDELRKGYLRNQDYTKKTQEVSKQRKEAEEAIQFLHQIKENPQVLQQIMSGQSPQIDPLIQKILELEATIYDIKVEREIEGLQNKYDDFDVREVLEIAQSKQLYNLEDAYLLSKSAKKPSVIPPDIDELKQQIRKEVLKELEADADVTRTIITPGNDGAVYEDKTPKLTEGEKKVARHMFKNAQDPYMEYEKWKNAKT